MASLRIRPVLSLSPRVVTGVRAVFLRQAPVINRNLLAFYASQEQQDKNSKRPCYDENGGEVTLTCLKELLSKADIQLFDVRNPEELLETGQIPGAVNIPLSDITSAFSLPPNIFEQIYNVPMPTKTDNNIVFHCRTGRRSQQAIDTLQNIGYTGTHNYTGGWVEWQEAMMKDTESES
ncbi:thiosulfate:glutathione sulfurtransferase isoform X2 [Nematostella vectensis]|uniref:thiosulfate:glutathione sulfurtransferase isoform X2 n=1 Tax=Nematostella vectensis TaxID=45351 RepID=UPI0020770C00|nr:thiosulfate:glutathione sulfurtransferase isoform X2 [Nematostella vectensis]